MEKTKEHLYKHSKRRALERYDLELDWKMFERFNQLIIKQSKQVLFLGRESHNRTHWLINDQFIVVFDKQRKAISTFLPPDAIHNYLTGSDYLKNRNTWKRNDRDVS